MVDSWWGEMYPRLIHVHILTVVVALFPHSMHAGSAGRHKGRGGGDAIEPPCPRQKVDDLFKEIKIPSKFRRFFKPDCDNDKLIFQPHKQGCLGALRSLEHKIRRGKGDERLENPSKWIVCQDETCEKLPAFRRCGSRDPKNGNPRTFKNGCRQCAVSCQRVVSGRRRYVRLDMEKCPRRSRNHPSPRPSATHGPNPNKLSQRPPKSSLISPVRKTTTAKPKDIKPTTTKPTPELTTTESTTVEVPTTTAKCKQVEKALIQEFPEEQRCVTKRLQYSRMDCSLMDNVTGKLSLPRLPPWEPKNGR